jgi:hypothetical protein
MNDFFRRFRGLAIAVVVVALSATAALAAAPRLAPTASGSPAANASESAEPSESESPEPADSAEPSESESPEPADSAEPSEATDAGQQGDHGALVSAAANMTTPAGFANHGAFVSCVAHLDATLATIDWSTVTPESCGQTSQNGATTNGHGHRHGRPSWAGKPG